MSSYVLDTSAIMCVLFQEDGAETVMEILRKSTGRPEQEDVVLVPFIALLETEYWLLRRLSTREAEEALFLVENWPVEVQESSPDWRHVAAKVKAKGSLSVADAWIASLAILHQCELVHKDPEFDQVDELTVVRLPYK